METRKVVSTRAILFALLVTLVQSALAASTTGVAAFEQANKLYEQGRFAQAAAAYDNLIKAGTQSPSVWLNLGNAHYKAGQVGAAIAAYRVAERQRPRDSALRANLQFVRAKVYSDERTRLPVWKNALRVATPNEWAVATAVGLWILFGLLTWGELRRGHFPRTLFAVALFVVLVGAGLALSLHDRSTPQAVIISREATARRGPLEESQSVFQLRDGAEVMVREIKGDWIEVRDLEKRTGWVRRDAVALLSQPYS